MPAGVIELHASIDERQLVRLAGELTNVRKDLRKQAAAALNETTREVRTYLSKQIRQEVTIKAKDIRRFITLIKASRRQLRAAVRLLPSKRIPLKYFGARSTKKGVSYRISRKGKRGFVPSAFGPKPKEIARLGGHVWKRIGKNRLSIVKLYGPSAWGVGRKAGVIGFTREYAGQRLRVNMEQRIKLAMLRRTGVVKTRAR